MSRTWRTKVFPRAAASLRPDLIAMPRTPGVRGQLAWSVHLMLRYEAANINQDAITRCQGVKCKTESARVFLSRLSFYPDHNQFIPGSCLILAPCL